MFVCLSARGDGSRQRAPNGNTRVCMRTAPHGTARHRTAPCAPTYKIIHLDIDFSVAGDTLNLSHFLQQGKTQQCSPLYFPWHKNTCSPPLKIDDTSLRTSVFRALDVTTNETSATNKGVRVVRHSACTPPGDLSLTFASMAM